MAKTLATRKQSQAIRDRMQVIRNDLPYSADLARERAQQLTDWRYHVRNHPWPIMAAAAVVGYLLVPGKSENRTVHINHRSHESDPLPKKSLLGGLAGAALTFALRSGASLATRQISAALFDNRSGHGRSSQGSQVGREPHREFSDYEAEHQELTQS